MAAKLTQKEAVKYALSMVGKGYDYDNAYGWQCFDTANYYWHQLFGHGLKGAGAADIPTHNNFKGEATVHENTKSFLAKPGDLVVFNRNYGGGYGHVSIVVGATLNQLDVVEQNWLGGGLNKTEVTTRRKHNYDFPMWFIRPNFKAEPKKTTPKKETAKKPASNKKKPFKLKYNRDEVKGYKLPKRGYKPKGIVIHNDASSLTAEQWRNALVNAPLSTLERGIAHSYISNGYVYQALPEGRIAWHTANNNGNTNYYGIEVCQSMRATDKQFLENEQQAFQEAARMLKKWKLPVNRNTVRIHSEFSATQCPHRSLALHCNYTSSYRAPQDVVNKMKDYFISQIKSYYDGKIPTGTTVTASKPSKPSANTTAKTPSGWKTNSYGILYKAEHASFTPTVDFIYTRSVGPSRQNPVAGILYRGQTITYSEVQKFDGHVWVSWNTNAGITVYMPIRTFNAQTGKMGPKWGTIN